MPSTRGKYFILGAWQAIVLVGLLLPAHSATLFKTEEL